MRANSLPDTRRPDPNKVDFFVYCPFGWRQNQNSVISRNEDSIAMHAAFLEGRYESRLFMASDINHETLAEIVQVTRKHDNEDRLRWDIMKLMHHCSYLSLGPKYGIDETKPVPEVEWLFED